MPAVSRLALGILVAWASACGREAEVESAPVVQATPDPSLPGAPRPEHAREPPASEPKIDPPVAPPEPTPAPLPRVPPRLSGEHVGGLRLGMTPADLLVVHPSLVTDGKVHRVTPGSSTPGPLTYDAQEYEDTAAGISVEVHTLVADGVQRAAYIYVDEPGLAKTSRGIGIGATRRDVKKAYPTAISPIDELWVTLGPDEMLVFTFEKGRVEGIVLGPAKDPDDLEE
jgi:hypothetical protein